MIYKIEKQNKFLLFLSKTKAFLFLHKVLTFIIDAPKEIFASYSYSSMFLLKLFEKIGSFVIKYQYFLQYLIIFDYLPRIVISISFFLDVFYFNYFNYFYKLMPLYLIVVIFKCLIYGIWRQGFWMRDGVKDSVGFKFTYDEKGNFKGYQTYILENAFDAQVEMRKALGLFKSIEHEHAIFEELILKSNAQLMLGIEMEYFASQIYFRNDVYSPYVNVFTTICFASSFIYIIIINVFVF